jgi:ATP-dependent DNA helicase RecG
MSLAVDNPILNNPFEEPREYWICEEGQPKRMSGKYQEAERRIEVIIAEVLEEENITIKEGKGIPDYSESTDFCVKLVIDAVVRDKRFVKYLERISNETQIYLSVTDLIVLEKIKNGEIINEKTRELKRLLENGFVEKVGRGHGTKFILSKRYYEYVGKKGEYTRKKGLDKVANKLLIIEHLKNYKKGYIKDFVEALRDIPRYTINRYLRELKEGGKIELIGNPGIVKGDKKAFWRLKQ